MASAVGLRADYSAAELRRLAASTRNANQSRRLLSLAAVLDGMNRTEAARIGGMDRQTLRDWVHRFNGHGPEGLLDSWSKGPEPRLSHDQRVEIAKLVATGPDQALHGVVRWRRIDLQRVILERFGIAYHERTIGKLLKALGFSHMSARPRHPAQDPRTIEAFKTYGPPRPQGFVQAELISLRQRIRPRVEPRPRWRSARPGPHKLHGIECHFLNQGSRTPVGCQAISLPPLADIIADVRLVAPSANLASSRLHRHHLEAALPPQDGPSNPGELVRQRHRGGVWVTASEQATQPFAERGCTL